MIVAPATLTPVETAFFAADEASGARAAGLTQALQTRLSAALGEPVRLRRQTGEPRASERDAPRWTCAPELDALWLLRRLGARRITAADLARRVPEQAGLRRLLDEVLAEAGTRVARGEALAWTVECAGASATLTLGAARP